MRGLRLFVRPIEPSDHTDVCAFLERQAVDGQPPAWGLLGKLLGEIVAVVALDLSGDAVRIEEVIVSRELRKKRIGRAMLREVEQLAAKMDRKCIVVEDARDAHEFFRRVGFHSEGERWVRVLS
ncbi:MAG TPA: GNAT family N-acetyltransferase [Thermoanaerobaculia bacterium]|nr:GNAT family N-acetyltransferase [Thermoanaerobaculia bacterium]